MNAYRAFITISALSACLVAACDEDPSFQKLGSMDLTTSAPTAEKDFTTSDGWTIKYGRFLVHVTAVKVAGADQVLAASSSSQIVDQVATTPKSLLSATVRTARPWEDVSLQIGPAATDSETTVASPAKEADRDMMQKDGLALYVEGTASKAGASKAFKWGFSTDTIYKDCSANTNGTVVRGLVVPPDGNDTADIAMGGDVLFRDDLAGGSLRGDAIFAADADNDGVVTIAELRARPLDAARAGGGPYATGDRTDIADLGAFVESLTQQLVVRFRSNGTCVAEPVTAEP